MKRAALFAAVLVATATAAVRADPPRAMPGPATMQYARETREAQNAGCIRCHEGVAKEWRASLHRASWSDASFQRGYRQEPTPFCRGCHAPESRPSAEPDAFASGHGVACVTCHAPDRDGNVLASSDAARPDKSPHGVVRVADFGTRACDRCHTFAFPGGEGLGARGLMQKTALEHAESPSRDRACASCHMPTGARGRKSHAFVASRDPAHLASALLAEVKTRGAARVLVLQARGVGHAFPTGDLFRRLVVRIQTPRGRHEEPLGRSFRNYQNASGERLRAESQDARLGAAKPVEVTLPADGPVHWEVLYQRVIGVSQIPPFDATVEEEVVLARGDA